LAGPFHAKPIGPWAYFSPQTLAKLLKHQFLANWCASDHGGIAFNFLMANETFVGIIHNPGLGSLGF